ncbi:Golgi transport complex subunit 5-domain-containing protein [Tuber brumale]|nr:Golgi transport complex subunit 5-domain-containing protein [Tuber brumale]
MTSTDQYIDYPTLLSPTFSPTTFSSTLISQTNHPHEPLDLTTPLSRVLFDLQEIDTTLHTLTTASSALLLTHTATTTCASSTLLVAVTAQTATLNTAYERLRCEVIDRSDRAEEVVRVVQNLHATTRVLREVSRGVVLARQVERQVADLERGEWSAMVRCCFSLLELGRLLEQGDGLMEVDLARSLNEKVYQPTRSNIISRAKEIITTFSLLTPDTSTPSSSTTSPTPPSSTTFTALPSASPALRQKLSSTLQSLSLLSPSDLHTSIRTLLQTHTTASTSLLTRALNSLTTLDRALVEVSMRSLSVAAIEGYLDGVGLSQAVLAELDMRRLTTGFWRGVAAGWEPRVRDVVLRGGASARILRAGKERVREGVRTCVLRGMGMEGREGEEGEGGFEIAVMVGALGSLGR